MDIRESQMHSFIVKLWLEKGGDDTRATVWHGYITHVPSGARRYLKDLHDIVSFIKLYFGDTGAKVMQDSRARSWLKFWTRRKR